MTRKFKIGNTVINQESNCFVVAEIGANHMGEVKIAEKMILAAKDSGANAVKFQTFKAEELNTENAPKSSYHIETTGSDTEQTWFELLKTQEISKEMHLELIDYCYTKGIIFLSTPYGERSADLLEQLGISAFKIASTDANNTSFLEYVAQKGIPMIIHILKSAIKSGVGKVYVASPDKEILEVEFNVNNTKEIKEISNLINKEGKTEVKVKIKDQDSEFVFKLKNKRYVDRKSINKLKNQDILTTLY